MKKKKFKSTVLKNKKNIIKDEKDMNKNKKAQVSLEMIIIIGILILGAVILASVLLGLFSSNVDQANQLDAATDSTVKGFVDSLVDYKDNQSPPPISQPTYNLNLDVLGSGSADTSGNYNYGASVTIVATPVSGYEFINWTDDSTGNVISSNSNYTFTMPSRNLSYTANFQEALPENFTLTVSKTGNGVVTGNGIDCPPTCSETYVSGTSVTLTANPSNPHIFKNWSLDCSGNNPVCNIKMDSDKEVIANFGDTIPDTYKLSLISDPSDVPVKLVGSGDYFEDDVVDIFIVHTESSLGVFNFVNWTDTLGNVVSLDENFSYTMPSQEVTLVANFNKANTFYLDLISNPEEGGSLSGFGNYVPGTSVLVSARASPNFIFINWLDFEGNILSNQLSFSYTMPSKDTNLTAIFNSAPNSYTLDLNSHPVNHPEELSGAGNYLEGTEVNVSVNNSSEFFRDYTFDGWFDGKTKVSNTPTFIYTMPSQDTNLTAIFRSTPTLYSLSLNRSPTEGGSVSGAGSYASGSSVFVSSTVNSGYSFKYWREDGSVISNQPSFTFTMPSKNTTLTAHYAGVVHSLTLNNLNPSGGTLNGAGSYEYGESVSLSAVSEPGYKFDKWTDVSGNTLSSNENYNFFMPDSSLEIRGNFSQKTLPHVIYSGSNLYIHPTDAPTSLSWYAAIPYCSDLDSEGYNDWYLPSRNELEVIWDFGEGTNQSMNSNIIKGDYLNNGWVNLSSQNNFWSSTDNSPSSGANSIKFGTNLFTVSNSPKSYSYRVRCVRSHSLELAVNNDTLGTVTGEGFFGGGSNVTVNASPISIANFLYWTNNLNEIVSYDSSYTFTMPYSDVFLKGHFETTVITINLHTPTPSQQFPPYDIHPTDGTGISLQASISGSSASNFEFYKRWQRSYNGVFSNSSFLTTNTGNSTSAYALYIPTQTGPHYFRLEYTDDAYPGVKFYSNVVQVNVVSLP